VTAPASNDVYAIPQQSLASIFLRFLRFGALAWGGPVAQIAMLRQSLVEEERWVSAAHFNRALALYQVLPGPEANELCVYFGMLARGRLGGILAGLGFMLPGFALMLGLSWAYFEIGLDVHGALAPLLAAVQAAVIALIVRAVQRLGSHILLDRWLWSIGALACIAQLLGVHFAYILIGGGIAYVLAMRSAAVATALLTAFALCLSVIWLQTPIAGSLQAAQDSKTALASVSLATLFWAGLKAGMLSFGGAYTAIPLLQGDAVSSGAWMTDAQFMDGIALSGLLPAPLIIFGTFVGYLGGGLLGALVVTGAVVLPAIALTLIAHDPLERLIHEPRIRSFLDGLTAAVVGLIAATAVSLAVIAIDGLLTALIFVAASAALFYWNSRWLIPVVIAAAAVIGTLALYVP